MGAHVCDGVARHDAVVHHGRGLGGHHVALLHAAEDGHGRGGAHLARRRGLGQEHAQEHALEEPEVGHDELEGPPEAPVEINTRG